MNKLFKTIFYDIKKNRNLYFSLILIIIIALVFGTLFIGILNSTDKKLVVSEINSFFDFIKSNKYVANNNIINNAIGNGIYSFIIWILGFSVIGIPVIICMLFYKSFALSFTIVSLIYNFKIKGILISFIYIFPHLIINLIIYFIITYYSFSLSKKIINILFNNSEFKIKHYIKKYVVIFLISLIILMLTAIYETYIVPYIIKLIY